MTGQGDVRLCKLGGGWELIKWMYEALFFPLSSQIANKHQRHDLIYCYMLYSVYMHQKYNISYSP